jgi:hypothetical protein
MFFRAVSHAPPIGNAKLAELQFASSAGGCGREKSAGTPARRIPPSLLSAPLTASEEKGLVSSHAGAQRAARRSAACRESREIFDSPDRSLSAITDPDFAEHRFDMNLNCCLGNSQALCYDLIGRSIDKSSQDYSLFSRKARRWCSNYAFRKIRCIAGRSVRRNLRR